jgi:hypothetical protein
MSVLSKIDRSVFSCFFRDCRSLSPASPAPQRLATHLRQTRVCLRWAVVALIDVSGTSVLPYVLRFGWDSMIDGQDTMLCMDSLVDQVGQLYNGQNFIHERTTNLTTTRAEHGKISFTTK